MTSTRTPEAWRSTPPVEMLAAAWLAGYSCPRTRRTYHTMIRSWLDWCAECGVQPLAARRVPTLSCRIAALGSTVTPPAPSR